MPSFASHIRPHVDAELRSALLAENDGASARAFAHLEHAHVLGQASTVQHIRVHGRMFAWGWHHRSVRECLGQALRIVGAATKTVFGLVPPGNTGGANVSPFKSLPVATELAVIIEQARSVTSNKSLERTREG